MQKPSKSGNIRNTVWQVGVVLAVLVLWRLYYLRRQPEMIPLPASVTASQVRIHHGELFWFQRHPNETTEIMRAGKARMETVGHSDLMATSLSTGETRKLAGDMGASTSLLRGTEGVYWVEPRPYPDPAQDLYFAGPTKP